MEKLPYVEEFIKYKKMYYDVSDYTVINYKIDLKLFFDFTENKYSVNVKTIQNFVEYLMFDRKEARATINRRLSALKSFYKYLYNEEIVDRKIGDKIQYVKSDPKKIKRIMPQSDIFKILDRIKDVRDRALLETLYSTGMREGELSALNIDDIDFENKLVVIIKGKGKKSRIVPISDQALKWIKASLKSRSSGPLFLNNKYTRLGTKGIYNITKEYFKLSPHDLRHCFATHMLANTNNLQAVSEMLGHSNINITAQTYTHLSSDYLKQIYKGGMLR